MLNHIAIPLLIVVSGFICLEFFIPIAIGELIAGVFGGLLLDLKKTPWLEFLSQLGLISLMFLAGFEIDLRVLYRNKYKSIAVGLLSFFIPFLFVYLLCLLFKMSFLSSVLMGIALSTTSLAIVFPILREKGLLENDSGQLLLASAMIVDIISMLMLSWVFYRVSIKSVLILIIVISSLFFVKRIVFPIFERYKGNRAEFELKFLLLTILAFSFLAHEAGMHEAVISFVLGVIFSEIDPEHEVIIEKLSSVVFSLLAPIFFFYAGSMIRLNQMNLYVIGIFFIFLLSSMAGKFIGTYLPLRFFSPEISKYGGLLFNYRLSFGLVTAIYGFERKILTSEMFNTLLLCILFSSLIATYLERKWIPLNHENVGENVLRVAGRNLLMYLKKIRSSGS
jgi:glutathione-regulated potassium-efflux system ancillary protein KefC